MTAEGPRTADAGAGEPNEGAAVDARALGERLGRYQLVMPLAQGGMGLVFAGRLLGAHGVERLVAIKTLRPITSASDRAALLREARLTSRLHHRNIVATIDLGEVDDVPYVVMELVDGVSLARLLSVLGERGEPLAVELAAWIVMQAASGLHAAHELADGDGQPLGLVHRDISPQNILLSTDGDVKIADFGIAKLAARDDSTATGMIKGKFGYMSPEQASAAPLDRRSDVFALGIVLWEALTNGRLFAAETPARTILRVIEHSPASPGELRPEIGEALSAITLRCLEKDPARRFPTAAHVAEALRSALRARGAAIDETDLAGLVRRLFGEERRATMDRLQNELVADTTATLARVAPPQEASALVAVSINNARPGRRGRRAVLAALSALVTFGGAVLLWPRPATRSGPPASDPPPAVVATTSASTSAIPAADPSATPSAGIASPPQASAPGIASAAPPSRPPRSHAHAPKREPAAPSVAPATPAPAPTKPGGQPFESL